MAFFDFFRKLTFFNGRDTEGLNEEDLDFEKWEEAHRNWRQRLANLIAGNSSETLDPEIVCRDDHCALGQWIHGHGSRYYGDLDIFNDLRRHHADFHQSAGKVLCCFRDEGPAAATKLLHRDFDQHSLRVIGDLHSLEKTVRG